MAIPAITSTNPGYEQISSGVAYARTITASNTPTSYAASGLPSGLSINTSTGAITGSPSATSPTSTTVSVTASNGDGTSTAQSWLIVVLPSVVGVAAGGFTVPMNLDLQSRKLWLPGLGSAQPGGNPPGGDGTTLPLATWIENERFMLSLGVQSAGVLQEVNLNRIAVLWKPLGDEPAVELAPDQTDVAETGSGTTARYELPIFLDPDLLSGILSDGEVPSGERVRGYLQICAENADDVRDYLSTATQTITTFTQGDSDAKTFAVTLSSTEVDPLRYRVTLTLAVPDDIGNGVVLVRDITAHWNAGGSTYVLDTNTGDTSDTGTPANELNWISTLTATSITATSTGLSVVATATSSAMSYTGKSVDIPATGPGTPPYWDDTFVIVGGEITSADTGLQLTFYDSLPSTLGTTAIEDGDTAAEVKTKIETAISETLVEVIYVDATTIRIVFDSATDVHDVQVDVYSAGAPTNYPPIPSYSNCVITCRVEGVAMPERGYAISSQVVPLDIEGSFGV
jgi:hypothetical protein